MRSALVSQYTLSQSESMSESHGTASRFGMHWRLGVRAPGRGPWRASRPELRTPPARPRPPVARGHAAAASPRRPRPPVRREVPRDSCVICFELKTYLIPYLRAPRVSASAAPRPASCTPRTSELRATLRATCYCSAYIGQAQIHNLRLQTTHGQNTTHNGE